MKYFYDTEFLEGTQKTGWFGRETVPTIDLISIGIVAEDGREYYAVSNEFNLEEAWNRFQWKYQEDNPTILPETRKEKEYWIRDNVLRPIFNELNKIEEFVHNHLPTSTNGFTYTKMAALIHFYGKSRNEIADEVVKFCIPEYELKEGYTGGVYLLNGYWVKDEDRKPELYGYYSAYDHVALCWLFGKMMNLPEGFPMYTKDLKQMLDEAMENKTDKVEFFNRVDRFGPTGADLSTMTLEEKLKLYKDQASDYPAQENEHNALADARWNKKLYDFIQTLNK